MTAPVPPEQARDGRGEGALSGLTPDQVNETVQALYARLGETRAYLRSYERETLLPHHDDCCQRHQQWIKSRIGERDSLRKREGDILAALHVLDPDEDEDVRCCARCGDAVQYLNSDDLCDGCSATHTSTPLRGAR